MSTTAVIKRQIFQVLTNTLQYVPNTTVSRADEETLDEINIYNRHRFFPDFKMKWCTSKLHYRVYILVAPDENTVKLNAGYCIMVLKSPMAAAQFAAMHKTMYMNRSNEK